MFIRAYVEWIKLAPSWFVTKVQRDQATAILTACPQLRSQGSQWALPWLQTSQLYTDFTRGKPRLKKNKIKMMLWLFLEDRKPPSPEAFVGEAFPFYTSAAGEVLGFLYVLWSSIRGNIALSNCSHGVAWQGDLGEGCPGHCQGWTGSSTPNTNSSEQGRVSAALQQLHLL